MNLLSRQESAFLSKLFFGLKNSMFWLFSLMAASWLHRPAWWFLRSSCGFGWCVGPGGRTHRGHPTSRGLGQSWPGTPEPFRAERQAMEYRTALGLSCSHGYPAKRKHLNLKRSLIWVADILLHGGWPLNLIKSPALCLISFLSFFWSWSNFCW